MPSIVADYRASAGVDVTHDQADLDHRLTRAGHFMAEEAPDEITEVIRGLLTR